METSSQSTSNDPAITGSFTNSRSSSHRDHDELWHMAKRRAAFKSNLAMYFVMNTFFVAVWYFSSGFNSHFWPIWPMLGWGFGLAIQYFSTYHGSHMFSAEREYEKLKREQQMDL